MKTGRTSIKNYYRLKLKSFPSAGPYPNVTGMRKIWGKEAYILWCGNYIYKVDYDTYYRGITE